ncbi:E3 ubiquitin-protein ligase PPP1R11 isoform X1 [Callithrix jacchus]
MDCGRTQPGAHTSPSSHPLCSFLPGCTHLGASPASSRLCKRELPLTLAPPPTPAMIPLPPNLFLFLAAPARCHVTAELIQRRLRFDAFGAGEGKKEDCRMRHTRKQRAGSGVGQAIPRGGEAEAQEEGEKRRRTGALPSNFGNGSQRKRWNGQVTLWTMNTWAAAHQNAAVFMRNLGPLVRALRKVMRRKKRAVVIHTVGKRKRRVDRDPGILTCCYSRTQAPGFP